MAGLLLLYVRHHANVVWFTRDAGYRYYRHRYNHRNWE
jgi:hypothetical protein